MTLLRQLTQRDHANRFAHKSGEQLAHGLGSCANIGSVTSCVRLVRTNVSGRLKKHLGLEVGPSEVIAHDEQNCFLSDWITAVFADDGQAKVNPGEMAYAQGRANGSCRVDHGGHDCGRQFRDAGRALQHFGRRMGAFPSVNVLELLGQEPTIEWLAVSTELLLVPGMILLAVIVGFLPAFSAYRTDVSRSLGT